jgi:hypothetical protein
MAQINESGQIIAGIRNVRADDSVDECGCSQSWLSRGSIFEPFFRVRALNPIPSELAQQETTIRISTTPAAVCFTSSSSSLTMAHRP